MEKCKSTVQWTHIRFKLWWKPPWVDLSVMSISQDIRLLQFLFWQTEGSEPLRYSHHGRWDLIIITCSEPSSHHNCHQSTKTMQHHLTPDAHTDMQPVPENCWLLNWFMIRIRNVKWEFVVRVCHWLTISNYSDSSSAFVYYSGRLLQEQKLHLRLNDSTTYCNTDSLSWCVNHQVSLSIPPTTLTMSLFLCRHDPFLTS